ncbi:MAG: hypothetical protein MJ189_03225, partial [Coriobacteriales bacterium]|nr:hypothetical protein [Coriobacteriales bacterium]
VVVKTYFEAVKSGDTQKAVECCSPKYQDVFALGQAGANSLGSALGGMLGMNMGNAGDVGTSLLGIINAEHYSDYEFKVFAASYNDESHATVPVEVYVAGKLDQTSTQYCEKINGQWYVTSKF